MLRRALQLAKYAGWWCLDGVVQVAFSVGVWVLCDLPSAWEAWKWQRQQRRAKRAMRDRRD